MRHRSRRGRNASLRVVLISREYPPQTGWGGIGTFTHGLAQALASAGVDVHVLSCADGVPQGSFNDGDVLVHRVRLRSRGRLYWRMARLSPLAEQRLGAALTVRRELKRLHLDADVIEAPDWMAEAALLRPRGAALVVHLHGGLVLLNAYRGRTRTWDDKLAEWLESRAVKRADLVTAPSARANRLPQGDPAYAHTPVRASTMPVRCTSPSEGRPADRDHVVAVVGRLDRLKAPEVLVEALGVLRERLPGVRAVVAGVASDEAPGGDYATWLRRLAGPLAVDLELPGPLDRDEVTDLYRRASVVVVPSRFEAFSMVAAEAMLAGTPVLVSDACGIAEWFPEAWAEAIVPADDPGALANRLYSLLTASDRGAARASAARAWIQSRCGPAQVAAERLALYDQLLRRSRHKRRGGPWTRS